MREVPPLGGCQRCDALRFLLCLALLAFAWHQGHHCCRRLDGCRHDRWRDLFVRGREDLDSSCRRLRPKRPALRAVLLNKYLVNLHHETRLFEMFLNRDRNLKPPLFQTPDIISTCLAIGWHGFLNLVQKYWSYCEKERPKYSVLEALWWILVNVDFVWLG